MNTVISLLERNTEFREEGDTPFGQENEDRLYEIPVKMLNDFNQQVEREERERGGGRGRGRGRGREGEGEGEEGRERESLSISLFLGEES